MWNRRGLVDRVLDASIYFSFDRSGFKRHSERFNPADLDRSVEGRRMLVTGANSGLGRAAALRLAHLGAEVWLLCRNEERGRRALEDLKLSSGNSSLRLELVDVSDLSSVEDFCARQRGVEIDALIHNAGILPSERRLTADGLESTWATNVTGPFLLTWRLASNLRLAARARGEARVINVTSGGMYTQKMDLDDVNWQRRDFDGVEAYAQTKRAEVILTELWADRFAGKGVQVHSMHPGWADTPAVRESLPRFYRFTKDRL
ncbi:MAG: SDR family NAD(P)-dependent oxidoreductase, partial [Acidobacteriota bacterium]